MNILTFDIEEWAIAKAGGYGSSKKYAEYDLFLNKILDILDERHCKGTFFCTGLMAEDFPQVVKLIESRGHDIGCHSFKHTWMNKLSRDEACQDTRNAVDAIEQCIGNKVLSYRAPAFSIGEQNLWMFDILAECGIERDASVFPAVRDFGGFAEFGQKTPAVIRYNGVELKEFPICTAKLMGKEIAYSGGGYFRFFPLWYVKKEMASADYSMTYFHIGDLLHEIGGVMSKEKYEEYFKEPGTVKARYVRYIKSNLGKKSAFDKLKKLLHSTDFMNLEQASESLDWKNQPIIEL